VLVVVPLDKVFNTIKVPKDSMSRIRRPKRKIAKKPNVVIPANSIIPIIDKSSVHFLH
jgi:hypothetical protein